MDASMQQIRRLVFDRLSLACADISARRGLSRPAGSLQIVSSQQGFRIALTSLGPELEIECDQRI
jgi:hypothetical protein